MINRRNFLRSVTAGVLLAASSFYVPERLLKLDWHLPLPTKTMVFWKPHLGDGQFGEPVELGVLHEIEYDQPS